ncbi:hypothetical protein KIH86_15270 [Paenibacillus sp. HN-1]|uniref:hypothetical protein n=1 Tax=Paenibacillus TaxID=44249 RepID=UPI001CA95DA5|nr:MULTISPECIES: hypothetical protein [Paenibacillus]MBY9079501.1 hypothetical protein [Paenibacillus sp. CGMCC 1.18879]MBY9085590.1 hypothetical protein [Paenibacillus sinensis]
MSKKGMSFLILSVLTILLAGCAGSSETVSQGPSGLPGSSKPVSEGVAPLPSDEAAPSVSPSATAEAANIRPLDKEKPPLPLIRSGETDLSMYQSTYCWGTVCADYVGAEDQLKGKTPNVIPAGAIVEVRFPYDPAPSTVRLVQHQDGKIAEIPLSDGTFLAPDEPGVYAYSVSAFWGSGDGITSLGDTMVVFSIQVK